MNDISKDNAEKLGLQTLLFQIQEECGELVKAVGKYNRANGIGHKTETSIEDAREAMLSEIADVSICVEQLTYLLKAEDDVERYRDAAFDKVAKRYEGCTASTKEREEDDDAEVNDLPINDYMYFDKATGKFEATDKTIETLYVNKGVICSISGVHAWINFFTLEMMNLYTGSSPYNYCLDSCDHHTAIPELFEKDPDIVNKFIQNSLSTEWGQAMYKMIGNIIETIPVA